MRLEPVEKPRSWLMKVAYLMSRRQFGADLHRAQAIQARLGLEKFRDLAEHAKSPHCDEREIVEITWLNAIGNYFNLMAVPLGLESDGLEQFAFARRG